MNYYKTSKYLSVIAIITLVIGLIISTKIEGMMKSIFTARNGSLVAAALAIFGLIFSIVSIVKSKKGWGLMVLHLLIIASAIITIVLLGFASMSS